MKRSLLLAIILPLLAIPTIAQDRQKEVQALIKEYSQAEQQFFAPLRAAKTDEDRMKIKLDMKKHPARDFMPKFQALATNSKGTPAEKDALSWIGQHGNTAGNMPAAKAAYERLVEAYADDKDMAQAAAMIRYGYYSQKREESQKLLRKLADKSRNPEVKASALFNIAEAMIESHGQTQPLSPEATRLLQQIQHDYPTTQYGKMAGGAIFAAEKLQIGMAAPDFTATDENGATFKLSDYRGKVVVLDFWGFW